MFPWNLLFRSGAAEAPAGLAAEAPAALTAEAAAALTAQAPAAGAAPEAARRRRVLVMPKAETTNAFDVHEKYTHKPTVDEVYELAGALVYDVGNETYSYQPYEPEVEDQEDPADPSQDEDDELGDRPIYCITECPFWHQCNEAGGTMSECSKQAWQKANASSKVAAHICRDRLWDHVCNSGKHRHMWKEYGEAALKDMVAEAPVLVTIETFDDRAADRAWWRNQKTHEPSSSSNKDPPKGQGKGKDGKHGGGKGGKKDGGKHGRPKRDRDEAPVFNIVPPPTSTSILSVPTFANAMTPSEVPTPTNLKPAGLQLTAEQSQKKVKLTVTELCSLQDNVGRMIGTISSLQQSLLLSARNLQQHNEVLASVHQTVGNIVERVKDN
eukprot:TRINITY_DN8021_c0_g2_i1.p1 TRINITY_DN8021_c0_g2~~TRINITY_DN8021_c0_g2_i1.p1  ORF type:complete len:383 (+),score=121.20 TRINITY_DN8021_c0_g2_i1:40-1188(+)